MQSVTFREKNTQNVYSLMGVSLSATKEEKDLGVFLMRNFHPQQIVTKFVKHPRV